ncbi:DUF6545 domain-containing protein [Streptomyces violascens]|uniref:DUF6545 domain-containing protein n=1 Tax=Streptomyces violascens TaxID=67381 RepID=UPI0036A0502F
MDLEQLRATGEARVEALRLPHHFSTRDLRDAVAEQRGRPIALRPLSTGVTVPAVAVLLVTVGLTLPALLWPLSPLRRPRWERNSFTALEPMGREVTPQVPEVVLDPGNTGADAEVEAAVIAAAVDAKRAGLPLDGDEAPPAAGTRSRKGDLPAETAWLLLVANAHVRRPARENAGVAS